MKNRLSKLQKWILQECLETRVRSPEYPNGLLAPYEIIDRYFKNRTNKAEASVSRSIRGLIKQGLVSGQIAIPRNEAELIMAMQYQGQGKTKEEYTEATKELEKTYTKKDKLIFPYLENVGYLRLRIITLTSLGIEQCLKLSLDSLLNLTLREVRNL